MKETIVKAAEKAGWSEKWGKLPPFRGIGIGCNSVQTGFPMGIRGGSQAYIKFNEDGGVTVISGVVDNGQGNDNMLVQIAAEELGVRPEDIQLITADTEVTPSDPGAYSQVSTFIGGHAVKFAAQKAREKIFAIAAEKLEAHEEDLVARDRMVYVKGSPEKAIPLKKVVRMGLAQGRPVSGEGSYWPKVDAKREWVTNPFGQMCGAFSFGTTIVEVEVDPRNRTGQGPGGNCGPGCGMRHQSHGAGGPVRGLRGHGRAGRYPDRTPYLGPGLHAQSHATGIPGAAGM